MKPYGQTLFLALVALVSGCVTPQPWPADPFPGRTRYFYVPAAKPIAEEQAIGTIKNLQASFCTWQGYSVSALDIDRYGLRVKAIWSQTQSGTQYVPTYGGFFAGKNYVPVYGGSYQPWQNTSQGEEIVVVPFNRVEEVQLVFYGDLNRENKWGVSFGLTGTGPVVFRFVEKDTALEFAAAMSALIQAQGRDLSRKGKLGLQLEALTPAQQQDLTSRGYPAGVLVSFVLKDGPAEKAGVRQGDVVTTIGGTAVSAPDDAVRLIVSAGAEVSLGVLSKVTGQSAPNAALSIITGQSAPNAARGLPWRWEARELKAVKW